MPLLHHCLLAAAPANKILAQPGTITGSIGVIFAKLNVQDALKEFGITGDSIHLGANATWSSAFHTLTEQQKQQVWLRRTCFASHLRSGVLQANQAVRWST
jgi:ClpP class serine protease